MSSAGSPSASVAEYGRAYGYADVTGCIGRDPSGFSVARSGPLAVCLSRRGRAALSATVYRWRIWLQAISERGYTTTGRVPRRRPRRVARSPSETRRSGVAFRAGILSSRTFAALPRKSSDSLNGLTTTACLSLFLQLFRVILLVGFSHSLFLSLSLSLSLSLLRLGKRHIVLISAPRILQFFWLFLHSGECETVAGESSSWPHKNFVCTVFLHLLGFWRTLLFTCLKHRVHSTSHSLPVFQEEREDRHGIFGYSRFTRTPLQVAGVF